MLLLWVIAFIINTAILYKFISVVIYKFFPLSSFSELAVFFDFLDLSFNPLFLTVFVTFLILGQNSVMSTTYSNCWSILLCSTNCSVVFTYLKRDKKSSILSISVHTFGMY